MSELLKKVIASREAWMKAVEAARETRWKFANAAHEFLISLEELQLDPGRTVHSIGNLTVLVEEEWFERPISDQHLSLKFFETRLHEEQE